MITSSPLVAERKFFPTETAMLFPPPVTKRPPGKIYPDVRLCLFFFAVDCFCFLLDFDCNWCWFRSAKAFDEGLGEFSCSPPKIMSISADISSLASLSGEDNVAFLLLAAALLKV